jgi:hypothetical protein
MATVAEQLKAHIAQGKAKGFGDLSLRDIGAQELETFEYFSCVDDRVFWVFSDNSKVEVDKDDFLVSVC